MKKVLIFDTETNGLVNFDSPWNHPSQPHLVQIACLLQEEETAKVLGSLTAIIKPDGWTIPDKIAAIHSICTSQAVLVGLPLAAVMPIFIEFVRSATIICAHNIAFDSSIMKIACARLGWGTDWLDGKSRFDTMHASMGLLKLPKKGGGLKMPKLSECIRYFFGEELDGAHDAMVDTRACARIYHHLNPPPDDLTAVPF